MNSLDSSDLPPQVAARRFAADSTPQGAASFVDEFIRLGDILDVASRLPDLGDRPLVVLTAAAEALDGWLVDQDRLATLSTNVSHRVLLDLTHVSLIESEPGAKASSDAIRDVVTSVRSGSDLAGSSASHR